MTYVIRLLACALAFGNFLSGSAHELIPQEYLAIPESRLTDGIELAEKFRRGLIRRNATGVARINFLARACLEFQRSMRSQAEDLETIKRFKISEKQIVKAIEGQSVSRRMRRAFDVFEGRWYGKWDQMNVDHHWHPTVHFDPPWKVDAFYDVSVQAGQFAWVGDGFGWNIIGSETAKGRKSFVLGTVYHVEEQDPSQVRLHRPHVGVICGDRKIIWMTAGEIFFEEKRNAEKGKPERYVISGFRYRFDAGKLVNDGKAFQAVYTRDSEGRPDWREFWVGLQIQ